MPSQPAGRAPAAPVSELKARRPAPQLPTPQGTAAPSSGWRVRLPNRPRWFEPLRSGVAAQETPEARSCTERTEPAAPGRCARACFCSGNAWMFARGRPEAGCLPDCGQPEVISRSRWLFTGGLLSGPSRNMRDDVFTPRETYTHQMYKCVLCGPDSAKVRYDRIIFHYVLRHFKKM